MAHTVLSTPIIVCMAKNYADIRMSLRVPMSMNLSESTEQILTLGSRGSSTSQQTGIGTSITGLGAPTTCQSWLIMMTTGAATPHTATTTNYST
jgi:hypothetical protein